MSRPIIKIVPITFRGEDYTEYRIEIPKQEGLLSAPQAEEFITHLQKAIKVVREANRQ